MRIIILLFAFAPLLLTAQDIKLPKNADGKVEYQDVIPVDSTSDTELLGRAKVFITNTFKSGKSVTDLADDQNKTIIGKGWEPLVVAMFLGSPIDLECWFQITIQCKNGKYKYSIGNFELVYRWGTADEKRTYYLEDDKPKAFSKKQWASIIEQADTNAKLTASHLKNQMLKKSDW